MTIRGRRETWILVRDQATGELMARCRNCEKVYDVRVFLLHDCQPVLRPEPPLDGELPFTVVKDGEP